MNSILWIQTQWIVVGLLLLTLTPAHSFSASSEPEQPWRVARVSVLEGAASTKTASESEWAAAQVNQPLFAGDSFYTGPGTRAEIQLEDEIFVYLDENTLIEIPFLEDRFSRIAITEGTVTVHAKPIGVQRPPLEVLSSYFLSTINEPAKARFDVQNSGASEIGVMSGVLKINRDADRFYSVHRGERMIVTTPDPDTYTLLPISQEDSFDRWTEVRTAMHAAAVETRSYVTDRVAGYRDLDRHGTWVSSPQYGHVWRPRVTTTTWAPYRDGYWAWREPAGWVWVSNEPWGWVPYHYGRWVHDTRYNWVWVPKTVYVYDSPSVVYVNRRPVWYPSLVSFSYYNDRSFFSLSVGYGRGYRDYRGSYVGWFPLGYRDPYCWHWGSYGRHYHRHRGDNYFINNGTIIINDNDHTYENVNIDNAVTVMPTRDLASGRYDRKAAVSSVATSPQRAARVGNQAVSDIPNPTVAQPRNSTPGVGAQPRSLAQVEPSRSVSTRPERLSTPEATPDSIRTSPARVDATERVSQRSPLRSEVRATSPQRTSAPSPDVRTARATTNREPAVRTTSASRESVSNSVRRGPAARSAFTSPSRNRLSAPETTRSAASAPRVSNNASVNRSPAVSPSRTGVGSRPRSIGPVRTQAPRTSTPSQIRSRSAFEPTRERAVVPSQNRSPRVAAPSQTRTQVQRSTSPRQSTPRSNTSQMRTRSPQREAPQSSVQRSRSSSTQRFSLPQRPARSPQNNRVFTTPRSYNAPAPSRSPSRSYSAPSRSSSAPRSYTAPSPGRSTQRSFSTPSRSSSPSRTYSAPSRSSSPSRSYSAPNRSRSPQRTYSAPSRSSSPSRSYSAPSRSSSSPSIQRSVPSVQRSAPSIQRSAPRSAPSRSSSPSRSRSANPNSP